MSDLVQTSVQVDDDLSSAMVIDNLELANVAVLHHDGQELDDHFRAWPEEHLTFMALLRVVEGLKGVGQ